MFKVTNTVKVELSNQIKAALQFYCKMNSQTESQVIEELLKELFARARLLDGQS